MKRMIAMVLSLLLVLSLTACGGKTEAPVETGKQVEAPVQTEAPVTATEPVPEEIPAEVPVETTEAVQVAFDNSWASNEFEALLPELPFSGWTTNQSSDTVYKMELGGLNTSAAFNSSDSNEPDGADHDKLIAYLDSLSTYGFNVEVTESLVDFPYEWFITDTFGNTIEVLCAEGYCWITITKAG